jgi:general secretion pathway protein D
MSRWSTWLAAGLVCAILAACSSPNDSGSLSPPDLLDQLANADLSAAKPSGPGGSPVEFASSPPPGRQAELYPGDDRVGAKQAKKAKAPSGKGVRHTTNGYELNFSDAELSELTKVILRDTLQIPYVYDPRVQGRVTVSTGGPVSRSQLLSILESVLAMNRGAMIVDGNLHRIIPQSEARQDAILSVNYQQEHQEVGNGYGISIVPLRYVSAETMTRMLTSLASPQDPPRANVYNNLLIIRGTARHRESLLEIAAMFDVDWMRGQSAGLYTLKNSSPEDVIKELQRVFATDGRGKGLVRFQAIKRLNAILALTKKSESLKRIQTWVARLDRGSSEAANYYVYRVENGRAKDLTDILMAAFTGQGGTQVRGAEESEVAPTESASRQQTAAASIDEASAAAAPAATTASNTSTSTSTSPPLALASTTSAPSSGSEDHSSQVRIIPDERNNKLLIKASGRDLRKILSILRRIDQPPMQVLINATLAEVTLNDELKYGVQFFLEKNNGKDGLLGFSNGNQIEISPQVPGLNFMVGSVINNPRIILDALAAKTSVRVVSSPSVVVLHNQKATLQVGDEVPITTRSAVSVVNPDSPVVNEIQYKNTGVILNVTPRVNTNGLVTMDIEQEISTVSSTTTSDTLTPTISQRRISSTIAVESGQMVVLGGLISEQHTRDKSRIPVLGKIPYVGDVLGGNTDNKKTRTELVVFLQPVVIRDPEDAARVAEEVRARMQSLAPRATPWDVNVHDFEKNTVEAVK